MSVVKAVLSRRTHENGSDYMVYIKTPDGRGCESTSEYFRRHAVGDRGTFFGVDRAVCRVADEAFRQEDKKSGRLDPYQGYEVDIDPNTLEVKKVRTVKREKGQPTIPVF
ncbi:MAG: hypothetical protein MRY79_07170 [Alphaproteobacteria bacterium]|nr:hypothetical protein [Alphaproteobacteria bacterium]